MDHDDFIEENFGIPAESLIENLAALAAPWDHVNDCPYCGHELPSHAGSCKLLQQSKKQNSFAF